MSEKNNLKFQAELKMEEISLGELNKNNNDIPKLKKL